MRLRLPDPSDPGPGGSGGLPGPFGRHPAIQAERTIAAPVEQLWDVIADPHHMPRWWPGVKRMEGVEEDRFTQVFVTRRGKPVRLDFHVVVFEPPWRCVWEQDVAGTPFERILSESITEVALGSIAEGTRVVLAQRERLRGYTRTGGWLVVRARRRTLAEALEGLERIATSS